MDDALWSEQRRVLPRVFGACLLPCNANRSYDHKCVYVGSDQRAVQVVLAQQRADDCAFDCY
eukprot:4668753-Pyramimonas_sp.AAC.1